MSTAAYDTVGTLVLSAILGAAFTAAYGVCVYLIWDKWVQKFGGDVRDNPNTASDAFQLAVMIGSVVFTLTTAAAVLMLRPIRKDVANHQSA